MHNRLLTSVALLLLTSITMAGQAVAADDEVWCEGEARIPVVHITPDEAREMAWQEALRQAAETAGIDISSASSMRIQEAEGASRGEQFAQFIRTGTQARIVKVDTLFDKLVLRDSGPSAGEPVYRVFARALVRSTAGTPDPGFRLEMELNDVVFRSGAPMVIELTASRDCHVTVLNLYSSDSLLVVFPNDLMPDNRLAADQTLRIPPDGAGWQMPVQLMPGKDLDSETLIAVATRADVPFTGATTGRMGLVSLGDALLALNRWLVELPVDQRTEATITYTITR